MAEPRDPRRYRARLDAAPPPRAPAPDPRGPDDPVTQVGPPPRAAPAAYSVHGDTTRVDQPSFSGFESSPRIPYDELFDAVETGVTSGSSLWLSLTGFARLRKESAARHAWERALSLGRLVRVRMRLLGWVVPAMVPLGVLFVGVLGIGFWLGRWTAPSGTRLSSRPAAPAPSTAASEAPFELDTAARAALGDLDAIKAVEGIPAADRTAAVVLAPHVGRVERERQALALIGQAAPDGPDEGADAQILARIDQALADPRLLTDALAAVVRLPGVTGPDLLHEISQDQARPAELRALAAELLAAKDVAGRASRGLKIALALEGANDCRTVALALHDAMLHADGRSLPSVLRLGRSDPCGEDPSDDCAACRGAMTELESLTAAVRERPYATRVAREPSWSASAPTEATSSAAPPSPPPRLPPAPVARLAPPPVARPVPPVVRPATPDISTATAATSPTGEPRTAPPRPPTAIPAGPASDPGF